MVESCGIILAGGNGTRLLPLTKVVNKHLLPIYDKPMIYYPLSSLMLAGIRDIAIITRPEDIKLYSQLFSNHSELGISITLLPQEKPQGIPDAYVIAEKFINKRSVTLILGDNLLLGQGLGRTLASSVVDKGAKIFAFPVKNPQDYGVVVIDEKSKKIKEIIEKPKKFISNLAVPGVYFTDFDATNIAKTLTFSARGELEIVDLLNIYLENNLLEIEVFQRGIGWMDAGSVDSLFEAAELIQVLQKRQGLRLNAPEEIAWRNKWISDKKLLIHAKKYSGTDYGDYLLTLLA